MTDPIQTTRTATITLTVSADRWEEFTARLSQVPPTTAHALPGERILDLALTALERQAKVRAWRQTKGTTQGTTRATQPDPDHPAP